MPCDVDSIQHVTGPVVRAISLNCVCSLSLGSYVSLHTPALAISISAYAIITSHATVAWELARTSACTRAYSQIWIVSGHLGSKMFRVSRLWNYGTDHKQLWLLRQTARATNCHKQQLEPYQYGSIHSWSLREQSELKYLTGAHQTWFNVYKHFYITN